MGIPHGSYFLETQKKKEERDKGFDVLKSQGRGGGGGKKGGGYPNVKVAWGGGNLMNAGLKIHFFITSMRVDTPAGYRGNARSLLWEMIFTRE